MATIQEPPGIENVLITHDALRMLDCFQDGLDEVVKKIAEDLCRTRTAAAMPGIVEITTQDVRDAAELVSQLLRQMVSAGTLSARISPAIDNIQECVACK